MVVAASGGAGAAGAAGAAVGLFILFGLYLVVIVGSIAFLIVALIDIVKRPDWQWKIAGQEKVLWILLVVLVNILAIPSLIYWFNIRKKLIAVEVAAANGQFGPGQVTYSGWEPGPPPTMYASVTPPSWQPDPSEGRRWRWWDGQHWTEYTSDGASGPDPAPGPPV
jgi:hypothetical protein